MRAQPGPKKAGAPAMRRNRSEQEGVSSQRVAPRNPAASGDSRKKGVTFKQGPPQEIRGGGGGRRTGDDSSRSSLVSQVEEKEAEAGKRPSAIGTTSAELQQLRRDGSDSEGEAQPLPRRPQVTISAPDAPPAGFVDPDDEEGAPLQIQRRGRGSQHLQVPLPGAGDKRDGGNSDVESEAGGQSGRNSGKKRGSASPRPDGKGEKRENIHVVIRVRPSLPHEDCEADAVEVLPDGQSIRMDDGEAGDRKKVFTVDEVVDSRDTDGSQVVFFNKVGRPLLVQSLQGYNVCLFAYGHTGSGKTYTMLGDGTSCTTAPRLKSDGAGLLPRYIREVFQAHAQDPTQQQKQPRYTCEFYEVYNEQIRDLLAPPEAQGNERKRAVHAHPRLGVRIDGLSTSVISSPEETLNLVNFGNQMRTVAATTMNERSSRSHAVFTFRWEVTADSPNRGSTVTFVDLAGREDIAEKATGTLYKEMCYINTSLFHLAHLISKIADGHIKSSSLSDFRNSKLTLLLSQALVGNSRTALVATVAPARTYFDNSISTLQFAQQVKKIETKPIANTRKSNQVVKDLEEEVKSLRKELGGARSSNTEMEQELLAAQAMIEHLRVGWEEKNEQSKRLDVDRRKFSVKLGLLDMSNGPEWTTTGDVVPFLTKLSDDAALQGCCNYILNKPAMRIGSEEACDILLHGVGIRPEMCEANCSDGGEVTITLLCEEYLEGGGGTGEEGLLEDGANIPRVLVNGQLLTPESPTRTMAHGDCLVLGYAHAFRLAAPTKEQVRELASDATQDVASLARSTVGSLDMASAVAEVAAEEETGGHFKEVYPYLQQLSTRAPEHIVQELLKSLKSLQPLIEEANIITNEVFQEEILRFELHALTDILHFETDVPQLVVCVIYLGKGQESGTPMRTMPTMMPLLSMPFSPSSDMMSSSLLPRARNPMTIASGLADHMMLGERTEPILYLWSMEKFLQRLQEMREIYSEGSENDDGFESVRVGFKRKPYTNPWREMRFKDVRLLAEAGWEAAKHGNGDSRSASKSSTAPMSMNQAKAEMLSMSPAASGVTADPMNQSPPPDGVSSMTLNFGMAARESAMGGTPSTPKSQSSGPAQSPLPHTLAHDAPSFGGVQIPFGHVSGLGKNPSGSTGATSPVSPGQQPSFAASPRLAVETLLPPERDSAAAAAAAAVAAVASTSCGRLSGQVSPRVGMPARNSMPQPLGQQGVYYSSPSPGGVHPLACGPCSSGGRPQTLAEVARNCAAPPSVAVRAAGVPAGMVMNSARDSGSAELDTGTANSAAPTPDRVNLGGNTPLVEARPPDIEKLRMELLACRAETGRFTAERDRFAKLLDRLEGLLTHLSTTESPKPERLPDRRISSQIRSRLHTQSHPHFPPAVHMDTSSTSASYSLPTRRTLSPSPATMSDDNLAASFRRSSPSVPSWPGQPGTPGPSVVHMVQPPAQTVASGTATPMSAPRVAAGAPSSATVPSGRRVLMRSLSQPMDPAVWSMGASSPSVPMPVQWPGAVGAAIPRSPGVPSRGTLISTTPRLTSRSQSPVPFGNLPAPFAVREPAAQQSFQGLNSSGLSSSGGAQTAAEIADILFNQLDGNKDGVLTRSEFKAGMADTIFNQLDRNKDGVLTRSEFRAGMALGQSQPSVLTPMVTPISATPRAGSPPPRTAAESSSVNTALAFQQPPPAGSVPWSIASAAAVAAAAASSAPSPMVPPSSATVMPPQRH